MSEYRVCVTISEEADSVTAKSFPVEYSGDASIHDEAGQKRTAGCIVECLRMLLRGDNREAAIVIAHCLTELSGYDPDVLQIALSHVQGINARTEKPPPPCDTAAGRDFRKFPENSK